MKQFDSVEEVLEFAIGEEENAMKFYTELAERSTNEQMKKTFLGFAKEEKGHKEKLLAVKAGKSLTPAVKKIRDLKIADYLVEVDADKELNYQEALILAMKKEKAAFKLYNDLADATEDSSLYSLLLELAQEEAKHKLRFEVEYDDNVLREM